jgi:long-chain acyl-CoA synthetase
MNIAQHVERGRRGFPERPALVFEGRSIGYGELDRLASGVAAGLRGLGVGRGDRVAVWLPNGLGWALAYLGALKIGAIAVSVNPALKPGEAQFMFDDSGARTVVTTAALRSSTSGHETSIGRRWVIAEGNAGGDPSLDELSARACDEPVSSVVMERDAPAVIVYTSGTTGFPKGAVLSHGNVVANVEAKQRYLAIQPEDQLLLFLPLFHCFGQNAVFNSGLQSGATVVLHRQFDPARVLESIRNDGVTMFFGVPTTFMVLHDTASAADLHGVRYFFSAAAPLPAEVERKWTEKFGKTIYQGYGLTETSPFASYNHEVRHVPTSIGTPIEGVEMKVVDVDDGRDLPRGRTGEIVIRGHNVMLGYWNRPEETSRAIKEGWFHTGDVGRVDDEGYFFIEDRLKDMINVGGLKVYPVEVENAIHQHPAVAEVAVYGTPDSLLGETVTAHVVVRPNHTPSAEEIILFCRERLAEYKVPRDLRFVESIPKSPTGKTLKRILREQDAASRAEASGAGEAAPFATGSLPHAGTVRSWLAEWLAREVGVDARDIDADRSFFEYGLTSSAVVLLARDLGDWLGRPLEVTVAWNFPTVAALSEDVARRAGEEARGPDRNWDSRDADPVGGEREEARQEARRELEGLPDDAVAELLRAEIAHVKQRKVR